MLSGSTFTASATSGVTLLNDEAASRTVVVGSGTVTLVVAGAIAGADDVGRLFTGLFVSKSDTFEALSAVDEGKNTFVIRENIRPMPVGAGPSLDVRELVFLAGASNVTELRGLACLSDAAGLSSPLRSGPLAF
ncbi:MAG: hypothetical protein CMF66_07320 [Magnetovibrio sp.]|nr:hypothetical protein [Magnetovibrio sp.]